MFKNIFGNYSSHAEILCMLVIAGIIGYIFHYLLSRKKWNLRFSRLESKILNLEMKAKEIEEIKDKQGLLFKNNKDMTLKINEFDALLGLTNEVDSISKTLNSLNFVSSKEFNNYTHEESLKAEEFRQEVKGELGKSTQLVESKVEGANTKFEVQLALLEDKLNESQKNNETVMNNFLEKNSLEFDKMYSELNSNRQDAMLKLEESFSENQKELKQLKVQLETQSWDSDIENLNDNIVSLKSDITSIQSNYKKIDKIGANVDSNFKKINSYEVNLEKLSDNFVSLKGDIAGIQSNYKKIDKISTNVDANLQKINNYKENLNNLNDNILSLNSDIASIQSSYERFESIDAKIEGSVLKLNNHEDNLNNLNDSYIVVSKELDKYEQLDQKVKSHSQAILELSEMENSVSDMKKDIFNFSKDFKATNINFVSLQKEQKVFQSNILDLASTDKDLRKELASVISMNNKLNKNVDSLEQLLKVHKHEDPDLSKIEAKIDKLRNTQEDMYSDYKKYSNEVSYLKGKLEQRPAKVKAAAKPKKRLKMADKLSIKGIKVSAKDKDDLKLIKGVGPMIEKKMNKLGIYCFEQVSNLSRSDIELITEAIEFFPGRIVRDNWKGQAKKLKSKKAS